MRKGRQLRNALKPTRAFIRQVLGQVRPVTESGQCLLIGLRKGAPEHREMLDQLEQRLAGMSGIAGAWFIPDMDRLVVLQERAGADTSLREEILNCIGGVEETFGMGYARFPTQSRFPDIQSELPRLYVEMGLDLAGFGSGLMLRTVGGKPLRFFSHLSAFNLVIEQTPELRAPLASWLGQGNVELLQRAVATASESFSQGWSGSLVDLAQRYMQWQSEMARAQCWQAVSSQSLAGITALPEGLRPRPQRRQPIRPGPIEEYQKTAEKLSLAAFSAGMAFTHDLNRSTATLFSALPRPAVQGKAAFRLTLARELAEQGVLVLNRDALDLLDRIDRIVVDARVVTARRLAVTTRCPGMDAPVPLEKLDQLLAELERTREQEEDEEDPVQSQEQQRSEETDDYRLVRPAEDEDVPAGILAWWESTGQPRSALHLVKRGDSVCDAVLVEYVTDHTVESLLSRARAAGLKVRVLKATPDKAAKRIRRYQKRGETVLALGAPALLQFADIAVGILDDRAEWPEGAHILTKSPLDTLWRLLTGIEQARTAASQSVNLAKIDAFSGLILALEPMDRRVLGRIRLAANLASFIALVNGARLARGSSGLPPELLDDPTPWHAMDQETVVQRLRMKKANLILKPAPPAKPKPSLFSFWVEEMQSPLVPVLMTGTGLAALTGAVGDALLISAVVGLNGLVGGLQRRKTENQLQSLGMTTEKLVAIDRDGESLFVREEELLPGDEFELRAGDLVPADARVLHAEMLQLDESSLTGESFPVEKSSKPAYGLDLAERHSMLYEGTTAIQGRARAVVVAAKAYSEAHRGHYTANKPVSGVEARLDQLTQMTVPAAAFSGITLLLTGLVRGRPVSEVVSSGVSLAVAAVPEGLPIMATLSQLAAAGRLSEKGALARNPRAVEALGRMTVLCADKTGTLTEGKLALRYVAVNDDIQPIGALKDDGREVLLISLLASPHASDASNSTVHGTDQALAAAAVGYAGGLSEETSGWTRVEEMPFRSERGYHATLLQQDKRKRLCVKGAPEAMLERCNRWQQPDGTVVPLDSQQRAEFEDQAHVLAGRGLRVLAVAERPARSLTLNHDKVSRLVFRGFVALADPIRDTAEASVARMLEAGIRVKMITGDHPETAAAIAHDLGLNGDASVLTGREIKAMSDHQLAESVQAVSVFARVTPAQKARIVKALQDAGEVVGMTGDGANDAPAIRLADVGIALGRTSSDAAQQAADLLVVDPSIETIVTAVQEGRALWISVRDAISLLIGGNLGEIGFNLIAGLFEGRPPLNARQLLLINLLTDTFPALAVALRKPKGLEAGRLLTSGPEVSLGEALTREIQWRAGLTTGIATSVWALDRWLQGPERAATVAMLTVIGGQLAQTVIAGEGSRQVVLSSAGAMAALAVVVQTPGLSRIFGCARPGIVGWSLVGGSLVVSFTGAYFLPVLEKKSGKLEKELVENVKRWITRDD